MQQLTENKKNFIQTTGRNADMIDDMLASIYSEERAPQDVKVRIQNRLACQKVMETKGVSFWWLPATMMTVISFAIAVMLCMFYVVVNMNGSQSLMPNFLQFVSEFFLKIHLVVLGVQVLLSWLVTLIGIWQGNLFKNAKIF